MTLIVLVYHNIIYVNNAQFLCGRISKGVGQSVI